VFAISNGFTPINENNNNRSLSTRYSFKQLLIVIRDYIGFISNQCKKQVLITWIWNQVR